MVYLKSPAVLTSPSLKCVIKDNKCNDKNSKSPLPSAYSPLPSGNRVRSPYPAKYDVDGDSGIESYLGPPEPRKNDTTYRRKSIFKIAPNMILQKLKQTPVNFEEETPEILLPQQRSTKYMSDWQFASKYGKKSNRLIGSGSFARVVLVIKSDKEKYALKEFKKPKKSENQKKYVKKFISEFCISTTLEHKNVIRTYDLIQNDRDEWSMVMDYSDGGDLFNLVETGELTLKQSNCYFKQLVTGVKYLHDMGVAHNDLKPENLLLSNEKSVLKITDFGISSVYRTKGSSKINLAKGGRGSIPYMSPESLGKDPYEASKSDIWAIGIIYILISSGRNSRFPWSRASPSCPHYKYYLQNFKKFRRFEKMPIQVKELLYKILEPVTEKRVDIDGIVNNFWVSSLKTCTDESGNVLEGFNDHKH